MDDLLADGDIEVIVSGDKALDVTSAEYSDYIQSGLDEGKLKFKDGQQPTRFVMRKTIPLKHATRIENSKIKYDGQGDVSFQLGFIIEEVRASLKDVKNPETVPQDKRLVLKFAGDGLVDERQMAAFIAADIVSDLYRGRQAGIKNHGAEGLKKS